MRLVDLRVDCDEPRPRTQYEALLRGWVRHVDPFSLLLELARRVVDHKSPYSQPEGEHEEQQVRIRRGGLFGRGRRSLPLVARLPTATFQSLFLGRHYSRGSAAISLPV